MDCPRENPYEHVLKHSVHESVDAPISRRSFLAASALAGFAINCGDGASATAPDFDEPARLHILPRSPTQAPVLGTDVILYEGDRRTYIRVPPSYRASQATPLLIAFHGAGGRGTDWTDYGTRTDAAGIILLAPESIDVTWDAIEGSFGPDIAMVNYAIAQAFDRCNVDAKRIGLLGFSDGASYALSVGLANGDQVPRVIAHSPGFYLDVPRHGQPSFFVSHGTADPILPIDQASRAIVPVLRGFGDTVNYVEFAGGHEVPPTIEDDAMSWLGW